MQISRIYRYPVKSMGGERLEHAAVGPNGIAGDRRLAILDVETGAIASAKSPKRWAGLLQFSARYLSEPHPGRALPPVVITFPDGRCRPSDSPGIDTELSEAIGRRVRLISKRPPGASSEVMWRVVKGQEATEWTRQRTVGVNAGQDVVVFELAGAVPHVEGEDSFLDLAPVHFLTTATLRRLEDLAPGVRFDHRRYRPNILLDVPGSDFVEQGWTSTVLWTDDVGFSPLVPTPRCVMSTLAHDDLPVDRRTLRAIVKHNTIRLDQLPGRWGCAGLYATPLTEGTIRTGRSLRLEDLVDALPPGEVSGPGAGTPGPGRATRSTAPARCPGER